MALRPRRSVLYVPGDNERALDKARSLAADAIIIDLEDSVAPSNKIEARPSCCRTNPREGLRHTRGHPSRQWHRNAVGYGGSSRRHRIATGRHLVPKVSHPGDIVGTAKVIKAAEADPHIRLWAMIETPMGIINSAKSPPALPIRKTVYPASCLARTTC